MCLSSVQAVVQAAVLHLRGECSVMLVAPAQAAWLGVAEQMLKPQNYCCLPESLQDQAPAVRGIYIAWCYIYLH